MNPLTSLSRFPGVQSSTPGGIRPEFKKAIESSIRGMLGAPGTPQRARMEEALSSIVDPASGQIDLDKLPGGTAKKLVQLQEASEGFESIFVKSLLTQMRKTSFAEKAGPYQEFATDMMDQTLADQTSRNGRGLGIAESIFTSTAPRFVREAAAQKLTQAADSQSAQKPRN